MGGQVSGTGEVGGEIGGNVGGLRYPGKSAQLETA